MVTNGVFNIDLIFYYLFIKISQFKSFLQTYVLVKRIAFLPEEKKRFVYKLLVNM